MKKALYILGELADEDVTWLISFGERVRVSADTILIRQGEPIDGLYLVLEGTFAVSVNGGPPIAILGAGEISFVDSRPPTATVRASEEGLVLSVPRRALVEKLERDRGFAARFYRSLAVFLADRLRDTVTRLGYGPENRLDQEEPQGADELDLERLESASRGGARFDQILQRLRTR